MPLSYPQIPRSFLSIQREAILSYAGACLSAVQMLSLDLHDPPTLEMVAVHYMITAMLSSRGQSPGLAGESVLCPVPSLWLQSSDDGAFTSQRSLGVKGSRRSLNSS